MYIHNFTVNLGRVIDAPEREMRHSVYTDPELNRKVTDFVVLVRRNITELVEGSIEFPCTHYCLQYTKIPSYQFAGITFGMSLKKGFLLTSDEVQTLLFYIFRKFSNVEIRASNAKPSFICEICENGSLERVFEKQESNHYGKS